MIDLEKPTAVTSLFQKSVITLCQPRWVSLMLGVLTFLVFLPAVWCDFVDYDDGVYVFENPQVMKGLGDSSLAYAFNSFDGGSWMPITWLSHMLDVTLYGIRPAGHHLTNILLHSATAALLVTALNTITRRLWLSVFVAASFALHPLRTESVVWVAERKDVLSALLWVIGMFAYNRYVHKPCALRYAYVFVCLAFGLMTKPMLVTFPFVLLLLDFWPLQRFGRDWGEFRKVAWQRCCEKIPLLLLVMIISGATVWSQGKVGAVDHRDTSSLESISQIISNYAFYVEKCVLPTNRTVIYPETKPSSATIVVIAIGLLVCSLLVVVRMFRFPWLTVGWFWFLGTLVPVIGFVPVGISPFADRYSYIPSIGLGVIIVWSMAEIIKNRPMLERFVSVAGVFIIAACCYGTHADIGRWRDSETLFESALRTAPHKIAYNNLAYFLVKHGEYTRALELCNRAIELDPQFGASYGSRTLVYAWLDDYEQAKRDYDQAVKLGARPIQPVKKQHMLSGNTIKQPISNDPEEAWHLFAGMFGLEPRSAESYRGRADIRVKVGDVFGAIGDYTKAVELSPEVAVYRTGRGNAHVSSGNWLAALADLSKAIELSPTNAASYQNRAVVYFKTQQYDNAWSDIDQCKKLGGTPHQSFLRALSEASGRKP